MCFGGPSVGETQAAAAQQSLTSNLNSYMNENLAGEKQVIGRLNSALTSMATNPQGFTPEQMAAQRTAAINNAAATNRNLQQATGNAIAGEGGGAGGGSGLLTGPQQVAKEMAASQAANQEAGTENQITQADALLQQQNQKFGLQGLQSLAGLESETGGNLGKLTQAGNTSDFQMQDTINQQNIQRQQAIAGTIEKGAIMAGTFGAGGAAALCSGESFGEGVSDFFSGGANALAGQNLFKVNG